jgi:hypothetical protein
MGDCGAESRKRISGPSSEQTRALLARPHSRTRGILSRYDRMLWIVS